MARSGTAGDPLVTRPEAPSANVQNGALSAAAAAIDTVVADTGPLAAGEYEIEFTAAVLGVAVAGVGLVVEHRNAANGANITILGGVGGGGGALSRCVKRVVIAANERIRVKVDAVALPATTKAVAAIRALKIA